MKYFRLFSYLILLSASLAFSCREQLIGTEDENKELLLQGAWILSDVKPPRSGQIYLVFKSDFTVDVTLINVDTINATYNYRVEKGSLYFLLLDNNQAIEFTYNIVSLDSQQLVLSFVDDSRILTTQTYSRP